MVSLPLSLSLFLLLFSLFRRILFFADRARRLVGEIQIYQTPRTHRVECDISGRKTSSLAARGFLGRAPGDSRRDNVQEMGTEYLKIIEHEAESG